MNKPLQSALAKSRENMAIARQLHADGHHDVAVSRAYYAMFYLAEAALLTRGLTFSSHQAVISAFSRHLVRDGTFSRDVHRLLAQSFPKRMTGDSGDYHSTAPETAAEVLADAEQFVATVIPYLEDFMTREPETDSRPDRSE